MRRALLALTITAVTAGLGVPSSAAIRLHHGAKSGRVVCTADDVGQHAQLYEFWPDGSRLRRISDIEKDHGPADWAPDGRRLVFPEQVPGTPATLLITRPDGDRIRRLTLPGDEMASPVFTPDGHHIIFERFHPPSDDGIWSIRDDGTDPHRLTRAPAGFGDTAPSVSPDGRTVAFVRVADVGGKALYTMRRDGSQVRQRTAFDFDMGVKLDWAPDGSRLAVTRDANFVKANTAANIVTMRPDGSDRRDVTHLTGGEVGAFVGSYSPDGRWLVYRMEDHGAFSMRMIHPDGTGERTVLDFPVRCRASDWGPRPSRDRGDR
jgi:Tol biopolymer transport system component